MLRRLSILLSIVFAIALGSVVYIQAQELDYQTAYNDYIYVRDEYRAAHEAYETARASYQSSQTFRLREEAEEKTRQMLVKRDDLLRAYLTAIRSKASEIPGISGDDLSQIYTNIDSEVLWYQSHMDAYSEDDNLEALVQKSNGAQERYNNITEGLIYGSLYRISYGKVSGFRLTEEAILDGLKNEVERIQANGDKETAVINTWFGDIEVKLSESRQLQDEANAAFDEENSRKNNHRGAYSGGVEVLKESFSALGEVADYFDQIISEVRRADE